MVTAKCKLELRCFGIARPIADALKVLLATSGAISASVVDGLTQHSDAVVEFPNGVDARIRISVRYLSEPGAHWTDRFALESYQIWLRCKSASMLWATRSLIISRLSGLIRRGGTIREGFSSRSPTMTCASGQTLPMELPSLQMSSHTSWTDREVSALLPQLRRWQPVLLPLNERAVQLLELRDRFEIFGSVSLKDISIRAASLARSILVMHNAIRLEVGCLTLCMHH